MTVSPKVLYEGGQLDDTVSILVTAGFRITGAVITAASFTNTDTSAHTITVYIVRNTDSPSDANEVISARQLAPGQTYISSELQNQILNPGDTIQAFSDTADVVTCAGISGYIVTQ